MRIKRMTATFGRLEGETLTFGEGLNIIAAPNEWGKSTWCAFLRAMFYGIPTRERDKQGTMAEKNRYAPWSGAPMAGEVDITWNGRDITLRRFPKGASPFGGFEAVDTATGAPVPELTAENCGETLLGVGRETYQRSAFVGQSGLTIDGDPELERRIAALVSSGEEDVSYSETEKILKGWLNRRKHNKTGLIPRLEEELDQGAERAAQMKHLTRQLTEGEGQREELDARRQALEAEAAAQKARQEWALREQYHAAAKELAAAREELAALEGVSVPDREVLMAAQGDLAYWNTLDAQCREAANALEPARDAAGEAEAAAADPVFGKMTPEEAESKAREDVRLLKGGRAAPLLLLVVGLILLSLGAGRLAGGGSRLSAVLSLAVAVFDLAVGLGVYRKQRAVLVPYGVKTADDITRLALEYGQRRRAADEAKEKADAVETSLRSLTAQRDALRDKLLAFAAPFAPEVNDLYGVSAALSRALTLDQSRETARVKVQAAQRLVSSIPYTPDPQRTAPAVPPPPMERSPAETAAVLAAVQGELGRLDRDLAALKGRRAGLGDPAELEARQDALAEELSRRREEYDALALSLEVLGEANADLQARFSPELNRRAGEIFAALTGGKYEALTLTRDFEASAKEAGGVLPRRALALSRGTVDQLYLAVRLAVCELALGAGDRAPLVLDDALANFDDSRMALALDYLRTLPGQTLLFTCHSREAAYCPGCICRQNGV